MLNGDIITMVRVARMPETTDLCRQARKPVQAKPAVCFASQWPRTDALQTTIGSFYVS